MATRTFISVSTVFGDWYADLVQHVSGNTVHFLSDAKELKGVQLPEYPACDAPQTKSMFLLRDRGGAIEGTGKVYVIEDGNGELIPFHWDKVNILRWKGVIEQGRWESVK